MTRWSRRGGGGSEAGREGQQEDEDVVDDILVVVEDEDEEQDGAKQEEVKASALVAAALTAVATFPEAAGASRDHECVACLCHPQEKGWGARTWLSLPCSSADSHAR